MGDRSSIEWTQATWTPIVARRRDTGKVGFHCEHASDGCRNCYAETFNRRGLPSRGTGLAYKPGHRADVDIMLDEKTLLQPLHWRRPRMIFVCSMTDLFADFVLDEMIDRVFAVMALCPHHTFQLLTKRPERMRTYVAGLCNRDDLVAEAAVQIARAIRGNSESLRRSIMLDVRSPLRNVWLGCSVEDQATADARIPHLLATPAALRWLSAEPLLGPVDLRPWLSDRDGCDQCEKDGPRCDCPTVKAVWLDGAYDEEKPETCWTRRVVLDWVVAGGESGPHARPMHPAWARAIRDQCAAAGVAFHFKQRGAWSWLAENEGEWPTDADGFIRLTYSGERRDGGWPMQRVGKRHAGRLLDGIEHNGMPGPRP